ncbi:hypothetical protein N665_1296s0002 [Sinapis alba]|nr:hypothetical protein N665_1296s0002 [Sinapis alba]
MKRLIISLSVAVVEDGIVSLSVAVVEDGIVTLSVAVIEDGIVSLSRWRSSRKEIADYLPLLALVDSDIWLSVDGSPQRRRSSLSMGVRDSLRDQLAFDMFCGKRGQEGSSIQQAPFVGNQEDQFIGDELPAERKERRMWTPTNDIVLISLWLNTSKDPVVGNEQKLVAFWKRIAAYFSASPKLVGSTKEKISGMNENDVLKLAHEIFFNNHQKKFTLEHAWKELRVDQK